MRIGLFTDTYFPHINGVTISVDILYQELSKQGHEVVIVAPDFKFTPFKRGMKRKIIPFRSYKIPFFKGLKSYKLGWVEKQFIRKLLSLKLDILHSHTEFAAGKLAIKTARIAKIPLVHTYHTMYEEYTHFLLGDFLNKTFLKVLLQKFIKLFIYRFTKKVDQLIIPSVKVKKTFLPYGYSEKMKVIATGIPLAKFSANSFTEKEYEQTRKKHHLQKKDFILIFLGRISKEKSVDKLIQSFQLCKNKIKLLIVGDGPALQQCKKLAQNNKKIIFTGMVSPEKVGLYYRLANLFVNFSTSETQGITYIEALSSGLPLLVKDDINLAGVVNTGENGFTFQTDQEFLDLLDNLYHNFPVYKKLKANARKSIKSLSAKKYAQNVLAIYNQLVK